MALLQIHEPGQAPLPHQEEGSIAVGIDLGTTHSLVAFVNQQKPEVIADEKGHVLLPSVVAYQGGKVVVGEEAQALRYRQEGNAIASVKRLMGKGIEDIKKISGALPYRVVAREEDKNKLVRLEIEGKQVTPIEISAEILKALKIRAEKFLGKEVKKAVITVPAYFDDAARMATKAAAALAGLEVLRLINEPTAAALAYGLDKEAEGTYAIYDLGGGTFDISLLKMEKGVFQVLATGGNAVLGGDDFDREIVELFLWEYKQQHNRLPVLSANALGSLLMDARKVKEQLTEEEEGQITFSLEGKSHVFSLTREKMEQVIMPYVEATLAACEQVLADAKVQPDKLKGVVLVGGPTRMPLIKRKVGEFFGTVVHSDVDPDKVVALGAALQADGLTQGSQNLLLDVVSLSLGVVTMGGIVEKVIYRNTPIPIAKTQEFTTYQDGQAGMKFHIVQGEREMETQNRSLAHMELKGIPPLPAGMARVEVTFAVDADGLLTVRAKEKTTGIMQQVEVKPSYGLDEKEMLAMLRSAMQHGKEDMEGRLLAEAKVEAERMLYALSQALVQDQELLSEEEKKKLERHSTLLRQALTGADRAAIVAAQETLEKESSHFIQERVNKHIGKALRGHSITEWE